MSQTEPTEPMPGIMGPNVPNLPDMPMGFMSSVSSSSFQQLSTLDMQMGLVTAAPDISGPQGLFVNKQMQHVEPKGYSQLLGQVKPQEVMDSLLVDPGSLALSASNKRKEPVQIESIHPAPQHMPNKRMVQMRPVSSISGFQSSSASNKRTGQVPVAATSKKIGQMDRLGSQKAITPKGQTTQLGLSPKNGMESFESVRAKLRESLAAALEMVLQQRHEVSNAGKDSQGGQDKSPTVVKDAKGEAAVTQTHDEDSTRSAGSSSASVDSTCVPEIPVENFVGRDYSSFKKDYDGKEGTTDASGACKQDAQEFQSTTDLNCEDIPFSDGFFVKDELLQGNGLSWVMDLDTEAAGGSETQTSNKQKVGEVELVGEKVGKAVQSPHNLADQIEADLFKLFGGVNKKYKEKGRSLMFNLKDRNNPELRERVMSGEISPKRLCSMTAEELASKELSQWRIAKAEELAQMVVLPDTEVDLRRLVKKTHKGEFQVEVEQDDSVTMELSVGASSLTQVRPKSSTKEAAPYKPGGAKDENRAGGKGNLEGQNVQKNVTILPNEGADPMQGLEVDEMKDTEFLPPIVSLDEFMQSLDSEPPFENLPQEAEKTSAVLEKKKSDVQPDSKSSAHQAPKDTIDAMRDKPENVTALHSGSDTNALLSNIFLHSEASNSANASKVDCVWEGSLQLSVSAVATVNGSIISGEKASTKEWPTLLEIKGRVKLEAFEKFIQELPYSRSRAIMVVHFLLKDESSHEKATLLEVVESYVADERLGFAEPAPGVEIYICPIRARTLETLSKHVSKDDPEILKSSDNGLIGVVVWRKATSTSKISPKSSSHNKNSSKKQHHSSRKQEEKDSHPTPNLCYKHLASSMPSEASFETSLDDEDDVPPGFGPARDEDDLPEFKFEGGSHTPVSQFSKQGLSQVPGSNLRSSQAQQMRELIQKYGQSASSIASGNLQGNRVFGVATQPWEDDDDDIPEWQPQGLRAPSNLRQVQTQGFQQLPQAHMLSQQTHMLHHQAVLPAMNVMQGTWGAASAPHGLPVQDWRPCLPRSRGF